MRKEVYMVQTLDLWGIVSYHGLFDNLGDAAEIIKTQYADIDGIEDLDLHTYASTMSKVFDTEVYDEESGEYVRVFGYIFYIDEDSNELILELEEN